MGQLPRFKRSGRDGATPGLQISGAHHGRGVAGVRDRLADAIADDEIGFAAGSDAVWDEMALSVPGLTRGAANTRGVLAFHWPMILARRMERPAAQTLAKPVRYRLTIGAALSHGADWPNIPANGVPASPSKGFAVGHGRWVAGGSPEGFRLRFAKQEVVDGLQGRKTFVKDTVGLFGDRRVNAMGLRNVI